MRRKRRLKRRTRKSATNRRPSKPRTDRLLTIVHAARTRAKKMKGDRARYDLDDHLPTLRERFAAGVCELTGLPFELKAARVRRWNSPSIDRIDATKGYTHDNVRFVLWAMNASLSDWGERVFELVATAYFFRRASR